MLSEANQVVDALAKCGLSLHSCSRIFKILLDYVSLSFQADLIETLFPRDF